MIGWKKYLVLLFALLTMEYFLPLHMNPFFFLNVSRGSVSDYMGLILLNLFCMILFIVLIFLLYTFAFTSRNAKSILDRPVRRALAIALAVYLVLNLLKNLFVLYQTRTRTVLDGSERYFYILLLGFLPLVVVYLEVRLLLKAYRTPFYFRVPEFVGLIIACFLILYMDSGLQTLFAQGLKADQASMDTVLVYGRSISLNLLNFLSRAVGSIIGTLFNLLIFQFLSRCTKRTESPSDSSNAPEGK